MKKKTYPHSKKLNFQTFSINYQSGIGDYFQKTFNSDLIYIIIRTFKMYKTKCLASSSRAKAPSKGMGM